ncbi:unnamed protein product [Gadus morhua 'NCC']
MRTEVVSAESLSVRQPAGVEEIKQLQSFLLQLLERVCWKGEEQIVVGGVEGMVLPRDLCINVGAQRLEGLPLINVIQFSHGPRAAAGRGPNSPHYGVLGDNREGPVKLCCAIHQKRKKYINNKKTT